MKKKVESFADDIFDRKKVADYIAEVIKKKDEIFDKEQSLVIALDSPWGTGKTTFLKLWESEIESNEMFKVISYNAWEEDDYDNPLIQLSTEIVNVLGDGSKKEIIRLAKLISMLAVSALSKFIEPKIVEYLKNHVESLKNLKDETIISSIIKEFLDNYDKDHGVDDYAFYKEIKKNLREALKKATENKKVIFFIDELDRCRPIYAIKLLETVKHYFNLPNIVFIFALDMEQLKHSIATIYGQNMDSYGYLRRFFNHNIRMPKPDTEQYIKYIYNDKILGNDSNEFKKFVKYLSSLFTKLNFTFRDIDVVSSNINILYILKMKEEKNVIFKLIFYSYLIALKYKEPKSYEILMHQDFEIESSDKITLTNDKNTNPNFPIEGDRVFSEIVQHLSDGNNKKLIKHFTNDTENKKFFSEYIQLTKFTYDGELIKLSEYIEMVMEAIIA